MTSYYHNTKPFSRTLTVLNNKIKIAILVPLFSAVFFMSSCTEKATTIGTGLLPGQDFVKIRSTDTIRVYSYTEFIDSVRTNNKTYSYLGGIHDPYFGDVTSDFVAQLRLFKKWPGGGPFEVDSCKLFFSIAGAKGQLGLEQEMRIYEINEMLSSDTSYFSSRDPHAGAQMATIQMPVITKDTVEDFSILLPLTFGKYLMTDTNKLNQEGGANDFRAFFKGIYVTVVETVKSAQSSKSTVPQLMALTFNTGDFDIRVYYHNSKSTGLYYDFIVNVNSVRYNRYSHIHSAGDADKKIKHIGDGVKDSLSYLQAFNGVFTRLNIPGLARFKDSTRISVNKARLIVSVFLDDALYKTTTVPSRIYLSYKDTAGIRNVLPDYVMGQTYFDGSFNATRIKYTFNIASFVQEYIDKVKKIPFPEVEMYLPDGEYKNAILRANHSKLPVKFELTYTKF